MSLSLCTSLASKVCSILRYQRPDQKTVSRDHVPAVFGEPAIINGYRLPNKPLTYYFESIFHIHNETVNVWSHLIGCFMIVYKLYVYSQEFDIQQDPVLTTLTVFGVASFIEFMASSLAHLLHSKSPYVHFVVMLFDFVGCSFTGFAGGIYAYYGVSEAGMYKVLDENYFIPILTVVTYANFANMCASKLWYGHCPHDLKRKYMNICGFTFQFLLVNIPFWPRFVLCFQDNECSMTSLYHLIGINLLFFMLPIAFASHQPEKWWPGKFDILGHGHQIFHVLTVVIVYVQFDAIYAYHKHGLTNHSRPDSVVLPSILVGLFAIECLTLLIMISYIPKKLGTELSSTKIK